MKIKTGDKVRILTGKDKGKEGVVLQVFTELNRLVVEGINISTKHLRRRGQTAGQQIHFPAPLHVSNVSIISSKTGKTGRVGYKFIGSGDTRKKVRVVHSKGTVEDIE